MTLKSLSDDKPIGVIGAGNFGSAVANLLAPQRKVLLYARDEAVIERIASGSENRGHKMHPNIQPVNDMALVAQSCDIIFPIVPSAHFRSMMKRLSPHLHPYHLLIHGTKGFDIQLPAGQTLESMEESVVVRVGCLAGPNLSKELAAGQPAATVIASPFNEVIQIGKRLLRNDRFQVY
jgi:glycerol-3-phosphate dehydrogenase (NAD(P)+)